MKIEWNSEQMLKILIGVTWSSWREFTLSELAKRFIKADEQILMHIPYFHKTLFMRQCSQITEKLGNSSTEMLYFVVLYQIYKKWCCCMKLNIKCSWRYMRSPPINSTWIWEAEGNFRHSKSNDFRDCQYLFIP